MVGNAGIVLGMVMVKAANFAPPYTRIQEKRTNILILKTKVIVTRMNCNRMQLLDVLIVSQSPRFLTHLLAFALNLS